jgi:predicted alpha-1,2-mannosidase
MIGYHVVSVMWDAYNKGIRGYDAELAFQAMKSIATQASDYTHTNGELKLKPIARTRCADASALESYNRYGYVRCDDSHESVSKTLEYAYNDWCIAQMANALGKKNDYDYYIARSHNWINVYDPTTGFMRARRNGTLYEPFSPYFVDNNFTEANSWQYSFYVPHDITGLCSLYGKSYHFADKLNDLFNAREKTEGREQADITGLIGQYAHGNEPSHQLAYMSNYAGREDQTVKHTNFIMKNFYKNEPDGLIGNEDCGQMSAWYVLTAMGIYPVCPGKNTYDITEP